MLGIEVEGGGERADLAQVHQRERGVALLLVCRAVFIEAVADRLAERERVGGGLGGEARADGLIVPAGAGLELLGADHVLCVGGEHVGGFQRAHQASVKADEVEAVRHKLLHAGQGVVDIPQGEALEVGKLIKADAVDAAAAVIPQHQTVMGRGIIVEAPAEEISQRLGFGHAVLGLPVNDLGFAAADLVAVQLIGGRVVLPGGRAAGLYDEAHAGACGGIDHFLHVVACKAVLAFQIRPAEVDKDRPPAVIGKGRGAQAHAQHERKQNRDEFFQ